MERVERYRQAYNILENITPLRLDCGRLCNKICCKNPGEEEAGMYLFPGEEAMYSCSPDWLTIKPVSWNINPHRKVYLAICNETCQRSMRPLSCRIFPLIPYIGLPDVLQIKIDARAESICPIAQQGRKALNPIFIQKVREAIHLLIADQEIKDFIKELSSALDQYKQLPWNALL